MRRPGRKQLKRRRWLQVGCMSACAAYQDAARCLRATQYSLHQKAVCPVGAYTYFNDNATLACSGRPDYLISFCSYLDA